VAANLGRKRRLKAQGSSSRRRRLTIEMLHLRIALDVAEIVSNVASRTESAFDVNQSGAVTPNDALLIINWITSTVNAST
jgi:hypothetical protein